MEHAELLRKSPLEVLGPETGSCMHLDQRLGSVDLKLQSLYGASVSPHGISLHAFTSATIHHWGVNLAASDPRKSHPAIRVASSLGSLGLAQGTHRPYVRKSNNYAVCRSNFRRSRGARPRRNERNQAVFLNCERKRIIRSGAWNLLIGGGSGRLSSTAWNEVGVGMFMG